MTAVAQALLIVLGVLLTALCTMGVNALTGMRGDIRNMLERMDNESNARQELTQRLIILETEHRGRHCRASD